MWSSLRMRRPTLTPEGARSRGRTGDSRVGRPHPHRVSWPGPRGKRTHVVGCLVTFAPTSYSERQLHELDRLTERCLDDYECKSDTP